MSKWKPRPVGGNRNRPLPRNAGDRVYEADALIEKKRYAEALEILAPLAAKYPDRLEIVSSQAICYFHLGDARECLQVSLKLHRMLPDKPHALLALADAYLINERLSLARRVYLQFLERWPEGEEANVARAALGRIEPVLEGFLAKIPLTGDDRYVVAELHEESQILMEQGQIARAIATVGKLLELRPDFVPALNNLSQTLHLDNRRAEAIATAERVLEIDPQNFHALGNLARYLFLQGRAGEARRVADRLRTAQSDRDDIWMKKAETFSFLGDDQAALDAFEGARAAGALENSSNVEMLYHFAAVASWRLGGKERARELWRQCLKEAPGFEFARANLEDLRRPEGERNGPWAFTFDYFLRRKMIEEMIREIGKAVRKNKTSFTEAMRDYARRRPEITHFIPYLLERGDPEGRDLAVKLASDIKTPETLAMLRDFALGQQGSDKTRMKAARAATLAGLLPRGLPARMWIKGEWLEIPMLGIEISSELDEDSRLPPRVERLAVGAHERLKYGDIDKAERLLKQAIEIAPDTPSLLNNLAAAYSRQGKIEECDNLVAEIRRRFPDYFFGITNEALSLAREGKPDEAEELVKPLLERKRLHVSEFSALCAAQTEIAIARRKLEAARGWIQIWESVDPDDQILEVLRSRVETPPPRSLIDRRRGLWTRRRHIK
ncbi:MAG: tetratricopeptide repeat protein [Chloracidobacterium sp.]|nr:tetratricopeptide repeat protein [Chloracidobacterium sp.]